MAKRKLIDMAMTELWVYLLTILALTVVIFVSTRSANDRGAWFMRAVGAYFSLFALGMLHEIWTRLRRTKRERAIDKHYERVRERDIRQ
jgi:hypothetical protein